MDKEKKTIVVFCDWYIPAYKAGGPVRSVYNIVSALQDYFNFIVITSDRDLNDTKAFENIDINKLTEKEKYKIIYISPENRNKAFYKKLLNSFDFDSVYFNSLFSFKFTLLPLYIIKKSFKNKHFMLAPRGMLGEGSLKIKSFKKKIFLFAAKIIGLYNKVSWHATTDEELKSIKTRFGEKSKVSQIANLVLKPSEYQHIEKYETTKFVAVSRIQEIKNLHFAVDVFNKIKTDKKVIFDIYGPSEDVKYLNLCKSKAESLAENIKVNFHKAIEHKEIISTIKNYHFFFLPTLHENFGHSIFEAFTAACPVIISNKTPWRNLKEKNIGWDITLSNKNEFVSVIEQCINMPELEYKKMSEDTYNFAVEYFNNNIDKLKMKKLFNNE